MYNKDPKTIHKDRTAEHSKKLRVLNYVWPLKTLAQAVVKWPKVYRYEHFRKVRDALHLQFLAAERKAPTALETYYLKGKVDMLNELLTDDNG